jgi:hypothetical protein
VHKSGRRAPRRSPDGKWPGRSGRQLASLEVSCPVDAGVPNQRNRPRSAV